MADTSSVWQTHADSLRAFLMRRVERDAVEDLLQDVFVKVHEKLNGLRDEERLNAWVYQITRNLIVDHYRRRAAVPAAAEVADLYVEDEEEARDELIACIEPFIDQLPEIYREAVRMSELEGLTQAQVAEQLGLSLSGAKSRVQRGRAMAKRMLDDCCVFQRDAAGRVLDYDRKKDCDC